VRIAVVANPVSGGKRGRAMGEEVVRRLGARGVAAELLLTGGPGDGVRLAREALAAGAERVAVCGGDGTVHEVAGELAGTRAALGIVPCGRGNDLASVLGIPGDLGAAVEILAAGVERRIDLGRIEGLGGAGEAPRRFCTVASVGFDAEAAAVAHRREVPLSGSAAYVYAVLRTLVTYRSPAVRLAGDFGVFEGEILLAATANIPTYGGGMRIAPRAVCDDGWLDLCIVRALPRLAVLRHFPRIFAGTHEKLPFVEMRRTRALRIETSRPLWIYADGEPICRTPAAIAVEEGALLVLCPR
jgi:diacylglycerol kinase (ATP)